MNSLTPSKLDKCRGAMVATAIGDALGWPNEDRSGNTQKDKKGLDHFVAWKRRTGGRYYSHIEQISVGAYSDDTQLVLAVARSIIAGNWEEFFKRNELPFWLEYERGGGSALLRAAKYYKTGESIWNSKIAADYYRAGGNGAVMRILPHVIACENVDGGDVLMNDVMKDALITHGHPRALMGATCYAYALNYLLRKNTVLEYGELVSAVLAGKDTWGRFPETLLSAQWLEIANQQYSYHEVWTQTYEEMLQQLISIEATLKNKGLLVDDAEVLTKLHCFDKQKGAGDVTILAAIFLASKYANNPILGIKVPALLSGADTDTLASITGGLVGMLCGLERIPMEWRLVQDYGCLIQITDILAAEHRSDAVKAYVAKEKTRQVEWTNTKIGLMFYLDTQTIACGKKTSVEISTWKTSFGQTIYRKSYHKKSADLAETKQPSIVIRETELVNAVKQYFCGSEIEFALLGDNRSIQNADIRYEADLLYYHRSLCCLVAVDLKIGNKTVESVKRLQGVLDLLDARVKKEKENPSMGILINWLQGKIEIEVVCNNNLLPVVAAKDESLLFDKKEVAEKIEKILSNRKSHNRY